VEIAKARLRRWEQVPAHIDPMEIRQEPVPENQLSLLSAQATDIRAAASASPSGPHLPGAETEEASSAAHGGPERATRTARGKRRQREVFAPSQAADSEGMD
jgi:hypothetical protein